MLLEGIFTNSFIVKASRFDMTPRELLRHGIVIVEAGKSTAAAVKLLKAKDKSMKITKEKMSALTDSTTIVYNSTIDEQYIRDMWANKNFYTITLEWDGIELEKVENAYIREDYVEEDLKYYIDHVFSNKSPEINSIGFLD